MSPIAEPNFVNVPFEIELGGRVLPHSGRKAGARREQTYESATMERSFGQMGEALTKSLIEEFNPLTSVLDSVTLKQAVESYAQRYEKYLELVEQWKGFLRSLVAVEGRAIDDPDKERPWLASELDEWRMEILEDAKFANLRSDNVLTAKLASKPLSTVKEQLNQHITELVDSMSARIRQQLIDFVAKQVIGVIEWYDQEKCTYSRFVRKCDFVERQKKILETRFQIVDHRLQRSSKVELEITNKQTLVKTVQHLVQARQCVWGESRVVIPRQQEEFLKSIPCWILPAVHIVEGMLIRETVVEQDLGIYEFTLIEDRVQWHNDPAIVLGPFVLSAWGEAEITRELELRGVEQKLAADAQPRVDEELRWPWNKSVALVLLLAANLLLLNSRSAPACVLAGLGLGFVASILLGFRYQESANNLEKNEKDGAADVWAVRYSVAGVSFMLLANLLGAHGRVLETVLLSVISIILFQLYFKQTKHWDIAVEPGEVS